MRRGRLPDWTTMRAAHPPHLRLLAVLGFAAAAVAASATFIEFDTPTTVLTAGSYFNVGLGTTSSTETDPILGTGADFKLYKSTGVVPALYFSATNLRADDGWMGSSTVGPFSYDPETTVGPAGNFVRVNGLARAFAQNRTGFLGIRFDNEATGAIDYGWMQITTTLGTNSATFSARVDRWGYDDSGAAVVTPAIQATPEPSTYVALGLGAVAMLRRRRRA